MYEPGMIYCDNEEFCFEEIRGKNFVFSAAVSDVSQGTDLT